MLTNEYDNFPLWSPRGDLIAFVRKIGDDFEVFTIRPDGKDVNQLTHTKGNDAHLSWSPDGERIVFSSSRMGFKDEALYTNAPQPYGDIFVMKYDGTQVEQLTDNQWEEGGPAWQPHRANPPSAGVPTDKPATSNTLVATEGVEHLDRLAREPMVVELSDGTLFVTGYGGQHGEVEKIPDLWRSRDHGATWNT